MKNVLCLIACFLLFADSLHAGEVRIWTSGKHQTEAEFVALKGDSVELKKKDGKEITVKLERLSEADRKYVDSKTTRSQVSKNYTRATIDGDISDPALVTVTLRTAKGDTEKVNATELVIDNEPLFKLLSDAYMAHRRKLSKQALESKKLLLTAETELDARERNLKISGYVVPGDGATPFLASGRGPNPTLIRTWEAAKRKYDTQKATLERLETKNKVLDNWDLYDYFRARHYHYRFPALRGRYLLARIDGDMTDPALVTVTLRKGDGNPERVKATELVLDQQYVLEKLINAIAFRRDELKDQAELCLQAIDHAKEKIAVSTAEARKLGYNIANNPDSLLRRPWEAAIQELNTQTSILEHLTGQLKALNNNILHDYFLAKFTRSTLNGENLPPLTVP